MMSLEYADELGIVEANKYIDILRKLNLNYIINSHSNYESTHLSLASIMKLDHVVKNEYER